jgi:hypothetical protein
VLLPVPADAVKDWLVGEIVGAHVAAAWVTLKVVPAIVRVPVRLEVTVLSATLKATVPLPDPDAPRHRIVLDPSSFDRAAPLREISAGHLAAM